PRSRGRPSSPLAIAGSATSKRSESQGTSWSRSTAPVCRMRDRLAARSCTAKAQSPPCGDGRSSPIAGGGQVRGAGQRGPSALAGAGAPGAEALGRRRPHVRGGAGSRTERDHARARRGGAVAGGRAGGGGRALDLRARGRV